MASPLRLESLKAVVTRISATSVKDLPRTLHTLTIILSRCKPILSVAYDDPKVKASQAAQLVTRLRKQVGTLLNDKTQEGRICGVVLAKAVIESGGYEILKTSGTWLQAILSILSKPDPSTTKRLCIITLTKALRAIQNNQTLVREIGTPTLQVLVPACLNLVAPKSAAATAGVYRNALLGVVLESFTRLLPHHPTIFRSYHEPLLSLLRPLMVGDSKLAGVDVKATAQRLFALLHWTASKQGQSTQWNSTFDQLLDDTHAVTTQAYRSVLEDWQSIAGYRPSRPEYDGEPKQASSALGLPEYKGIDASCNRLQDMLDISRVFCTSETAAAISMPVGRFLDLINRILAVVPSKSKTLSGSRPNEQLSQEERTFLFSKLPLIHAVALRTLSSFLTVFYAASLPMVLNLLDHLQWLFDYQGDDATFRDSLFTAVEVLVKRAGSSFQKAQVMGMQNIVKAACTDLLPQGISSNALINGSNNLSGSVLLPTAEDLDHKNNSDVNSALKTDVQVKASSFLTSFLSKVPDTQIPRSLRGSIDRTAILTVNKDLMIASVLNCTPSSSGQMNSSILVFLARAYPTDPVVESILRPRMPVVMLGSPSEEVESNESENGIDISEEYTGSALETDPWMSQGRAFPGSEDSSGMVGIVDPALEDLPNGFEANGSNLRGQGPTSIAGKSFAVSGTSLNTTNTLKPESPSSESVSNLATTSRKRTFSNGQVAPKAKRVHFDLKSDSTDQSLEVSEADMPDIVPIAKVEEGSGAAGEQSEIVTVQRSENKLQHAGDGAEDGDSDDDSDFEIPPLVLKGEEEDEDSEYGEDPSM